MPLSVLLVRRRRGPSWRSDALREIVAEKTMSETHPPSDPQPLGADPTPPSQPAAPEPVAKPRKRRRWPWVLAVIVLLLLLLVALVPTLVSSGIGRSIVVSQVNQRINGHIEIKDLSLGWTSGIKLDGLVVFDASGRQILQLPHFSTGLTLLHAIRGNYALGHTEIDGLDVLVSREADGTLNWTHLAKSGAAPSSNEPPAKPQPAEPTTGNPAPAQPTKVPPVSGDVVVSNASITYEDRSPAAQPPVFLRSVQANVNIPDINQTISDSLSAEARIGSPSAAPGTLSVTGSAAAAKNNLLELATASVDQTLSLKGLDLAAVSTLLGPNLDLSGQTNGQVIVQLSNGTNGSLQMQLQSDRFAARGKTLNGARLTSDALVITLPKTALTVPQGVEHPENARVQIGDGRTTAFTIQLKNASVVEGDGAAAKKVINNDTFTVLAAADYSSNPQGRDVKLSQLKIGDEQGIVSVAKDAAEDVAVTLPAAGNPTARGKIDINADLKRLNDAAQAMQGAKVVVTDQKGMQLQSGLLKGQIALAQANAQQIQLDGNIGLTQITVSDGATTPIQNESLQLTLQALSNHDLSQVDIPQLKATGNLFGVTGKDTHLRLSNGSDPKAPPLSALQMLQKTDLTVEVPSLPRVQAFLRAFSPPTQGAARADRPGPALAYAGAKPPAGAVPASQPAEPPPADLTNGSATLTLKIDNDGHQLDLRPGAKITDLAFKRGDVAYTAGNIDLATRMLAIPAQPAAGAPAPSGLDQIQQLTVSELTLNAPTLKTTASLAQPIEIKEPGGLAQAFSKPAAGVKPRASAVNGRLKAEADLGALMALNDAMAGKKSAQQMAGGLALDEQFTTGAGGAIGTRGQADLTNLAVDGKADPETAFRVLNDVALDTAAKLLDLRSVQVVATTTHALDLTLKGKVADLGGKQQIQDNLTADLAYDLAPLWQVLLPLMTPEQRKSYADVEIAGKYQKQFVVSGAYPSGKPFNEAVQSLLAYGSLQFDQFTKKNTGIELKSADVPVDLKDGIARVQYHGKPEGQNLPPPMECNGGHINLGGTAIDLKTEHTLVTTTKDLPLLQNVSLNPALASWGLGDYLNNPLFVGASQATGQLNLTVRNCDQLAVDSLGSGIGSAIMDLQIGTLQLGSPDLAKVLPNSLLSSLRGEVPNYHITINKGMLHQEFTLNLLEQKRPLKLNGDVNLATKQMVSTTLEMPWTLFAIKDQNLQKYLPEGIQIPFVGQSNNPVPALDVNRIMQQYLGQAGQKYLQDQLLGKVKGNNADPNQPANNQDPLKALGDLLNKNKAPSPPAPPGSGQQPAGNMPQQQNPPPPQQDPVKALEDLVNQNNKQGENPPTSQPAQEDPLKSIGDLFKKKKK